MPSRINGVRYLCLLGCLFVWVFVCLFVCLFVLVIFTIRELGYPTVTGDINSNSNSQTQYNSGTNLINSRSTYSFLSKFVVINQNLSSNDIDRPKFRSITTNFDQKEYIQSPN